MHAVARSDGLHVLKLDALQVDTQVLGIEPSGPVKVLYVKHAGTDAVDVT